MVLIERVMRGTQLLPVLYVVRTSPGDCDPAAAATTQHRAAVAAQQLRPWRRCVLGLRRVRRLCVAHAAAKVKSLWLELRRQTKETAERALRGPQEEHKG